MKKVRLDACEMARRFGSQMSGCGKPEHQTLDHKHGGDEFSGLGGWPFRQDAHWPIIATSNGNTVVAVTELVIRWWP